MAKRRPVRPRQSAGSARKRAAASRSGKRPKKAARPRRAVARRKKVRKQGAAAARPPAPRKTPRLDRVRRTLDESVQTPPSSLDMDRHGSAARTGRAGLEHSRHEHGGMTPAITGGDVDVNMETAYFSGDGAPGGDNPTPDQEVVDDIGKALGVEYQDQEELKAADKIVERDKHRWELDPASSEDYKERK